MPVFAAVCVAVTLFVWPVLVLVCVTGVWLLSKRLKERDEQGEFDLNMSNWHARHADETEHPLY